MLKGVKRESLRSACLSFPVTKPRLIFMGLHEIIYSNQLQ
jgi:hypothetical protein